MRHPIDPVFLKLAMDAGIHFMNVSPALQNPDNIAAIFALDAQPGLITQSNSAIPAFLSTLIDPKLIEVLVAPMKAADIAGEEVKKGDWTTQTAMFPLVESTGETSSYGDYSEDGVADANVNFPQRQSYHYQVMTQWGERELEMMALARVDWANRKKIASVLTLNKFQNKSYFYGVAGLELYGLLNDPALSTPIAPTAPGGIVSWADKTANQIYDDIIALFAKLVLQGNGLVDKSVTMTLAMSPNAEVQLTKTNEFNVNVGDLMKKNFPNMTVKTAPEYETASGDLVQLIAVNLEGQQTEQVAFTEKLRSHPIVVGSSNFKQKQSQGTWGAIIYRPFLIAQMIGVL